MGQALPHLRATRQIPPLHSKLPLERAVETVASFDPPYAPPRYPTHAVALPRSYFKTLHKTIMKQAI